MSSARPHPHLHSPLLHLSDLPVGTTDTEIAEYFKECLPIRLSINRDQVQSEGLTFGTVEFRTLNKAEKALTSLSPYFRLSPYPPPFSPLPTSQDSLPRIVTGFGLATAGEVWELFRPVAIREIRVGEKGWPAAGGTAGTEAVVEFWFEDDARKMESDPPRGQNGLPISIIPFNPHRQVPVVHREPMMPSPPQMPFAMDAPPFVPMNGPDGWTSPGGSYSELAPVGGLALGFGPGQQVQPAPPIGMGSTSASGLIDPCNLFCKNLDPQMSSNDLFGHFRSFGRIVSARVMRDDHGASKGFGFVSYQTPQEAQLALSRMDGALLSSKQITVRLHEPKGYRAEKLADRARTGSKSPVGAYADLSADPHGPGSPGHGRRASGGSFVATPPRSSPGLNVVELQAMTPERRKSVLTAEVGKRVREYSGVKKDDVDGVVRALVGLDLGVVDALRDRVLLGEKVSEALTLVKAEAASVHPTPPASNLASPTPPSGASHPGPPTTPLADRSERERLLHAISKIESDPTKAKEVTEMILSLSRKERALCLFNNEVLKLKVSEAKAVIDSLEDDDEDTEGGPSALYPSPGKIKAPFATPQRTRSAPIDPTSPLSPEASVAQGAAVPASTPTSPAVSGTAALPKTVEGNGASVALKPIEEVAAWSTKDILTYVRENEAAINSGGLEGVPKPEEGKRREMDVFLDSLAGKPVVTQKQMLGERLFKLMKTWNLPRTIRAPKVTIHLLDTEDFASLGHVMAEYPEVLRRKVLLEPKA